MVRKLIKRDSLGRRTDRVKNREVNQMQSLRAQGLTDAEIAVKLKRKQETIKSHLDSTNSSGASKERQITLNPFQETPHKQEIRNLAKALINEIDSLLVRDSFILDLVPGQLSQGKQRFPVKITEEGEIRIILSIEGEEDIDILSKALCTYLETGGFANCLVDIASWSGGMADNLKKYHKQFTTVRKRLEHTYDTSIETSNPIDRQGQPIFTQPGFTMYFPVLICADAIEQTRRTIQYKDFEYGREGLNLKFGPYTIFIGTSTSDEHMQLFVDAHREWRARCAMWEQTKAITKQRQELDKIATDINKQLKKFIHMERLPGYCTLCS